MTNPPDRQRLGQVWRWTLASGVVTIVLAVIAALLPLVEWAPRSGLVGWMLLVAGAAELALGVKRGGGAVSAASIVSGLLTAIAGLLLIFRPLAGYVPVANLVVIWLFVRGGWVSLTAFRTWGRRTAGWLALSGAVDILLALALLAGLAVSSLVIMLFGPTPVVVAKFSLILAASFLVTGISHVAIAMIQRRASTV
jgi:uncharacterized membrane protein HdeD (DUF308 family)